MPRRNHKTKPPKPTLRNQSCSSKRAFSGAASANQAITEQAGHSAVQLRSYLCTSCGQWHLTSQSS